MDGPPLRIGPRCGSRGCQKPRGFVAFMVGAALMVAGVVAAVVEVVVPPIDMVPVAVAVRSWPIAAVSAPRVTTPIAAIAMACHLSFRFCIIPLAVRSFAT